MPGGRTVAAGSLSLELDGKDVGPIRSVSGGDAYADVVVEPPARTYYAKKHVANVRWTPLKVSGGIARGAPLKDWLAGALTGDFVRKDGAVVERDATGTARSKRAFTAAVMSAVTIPASDASAKEPSYFTVEIAPEAVTDA